MNLCPEIQIGDEDTFRLLEIYSKNRPEWLYAYFGAVGDSIIITVYDTFGDFALEYIFNQTKLTIIVAEASVLNKILNLSKEGKTCQIKNLIVLDKHDELNTCEVLKRQGFIIFTFDEDKKSEKIKEKMSNLILQDLIL